MEHHGVGQAIDGTVRGFAERGAIRISGNGSGLITNGLWRAPVLVSVDWGNIESAMAEGAVGDGAVADVGLVGEVDLQDSDVTYDGGGDGD